MWAWYSRFEVRCRLALMVFVIGFFVVLMVVVSAVFLSLFFDVAAISDPLIFAAAFVDADSPSVAATSPTNAIECPTPCPTLYDVGISSDSSCSIVAPFWRVFISCSSSCVKYSAPGSFPSSASLL